VKIALTVIDFLLLAMALQGFILAGLLFYASKKIKNYRWLAGIILIISYHTVVMEVLNSSVPTTFPYIYFVLPTVRLALGPLFYFYTRSLLFGDKRLRSKDYRHFIALILEAGPQVFFIFHFSGLLNIPGVSNWYLPIERWWTVFPSTNSGELPFFLSIVIYSAWCFKLLHHNRLNEQTSAYWLKDIKWLKKLFHFVFAIIAVWTVIFILAYFDLPTPRWVMKYTTIVLVVGFAYWLGMSAYVRQSKMSIVDVETYNQSPVKIYFSDAEAEKYTRQVILLMEQERLFLDPALKVDVLAIKLKISEKLVSHLLNQHIGKNFNDFVNGYRIAEASKKLIDPTQRQFTIAAVAFDCGFNSLATFQRCFKQFTGITPTQYQNGLKPQNA
jgi:AraC-like DNA-binding protein